MTRLLQRIALGLLFLLCLLSAAGYAMAQAPLAGAPHGSLTASGPQAATILDLWRVFLVLCTAVFLAIVAVLLATLWRGQRARAEAATPPDLTMLHRPEPGPRRAVLLALAASVVGLLLLIAASFHTDRRLDRELLAGALNIEVTANQWWWSARYREGPAPDEFTTANELHIPVGRPVLVTLRSNDVIHSFWVPNLAGKKDLIPGRTALLQLQADRPGVFRGQCAEFCGLQHALMSLIVVAEPAEQFEAWVRAQRAVAREPVDDQARRGRSVFQNATCAMCHAVRGTPANGQRGPDLTHLASRQTLASGTLARTREHLARWITDPHSHKPGVNMPPTPLSPQDLDALLAYLEQLQ